MSSLVCCLSKVCRTESSYELVDGMERMASTPGPREPEAMSMLRDKDVVGPLELEIIKTGARFTLPPPASSLSSACLVLCAAVLLC